MDGEPDPAPVLKRRQPVCPERRKVHIQPDELQSQPGAQRAVLLRSLQSDQRRHTEPHGFLRLRRNLSDAAQHNSRAVSELRQILALRHAGEHKYRIQSGLDARNDVGIHPIADDDRLG